MSSFASLMLISTLGKNAIYEDEIYGKLFREALADEDEDEDENGNDVKEDTEVDEAIEIDVKPAKKVETKKKKPKKVLWKRSHTVPRRSHSIENIENGNVFYVNDGFLSATAKDDRAASEEARRASFHSKASVRSTPGYTRGSNYVVSGEDYFSSIIHPLTKGEHFREIKALDQLVNVLSLRIYLVTWHLPMNSNITGQ